MSFHGYGARNTSVFDNAIWNSTHGAYVGFTLFHVRRVCACTVVNLGDKKSKIQYGIGKNGDDEEKYNVPNVVLNAHDHVFTSG